MDDFHSMILQAINTIMVTFVIIRYPFTILVAGFTNPDDLTKDNLKHCHFDGRPLIAQGLLMKVNK